MQAAEEDDTYLFAIVSFAWVHRDGVWFGFVMSALLLAVVFCWVDRCVASWVLLGLFCLVRVILTSSRPGGASDKQEI